MSDSNVFIWGCCVRSNDFVNCFRRISCFSGVFSVVNCQRRWFISNNILQSACRNVKAVYIGVSCVLFTLGLVGGFARIVLRFGVDLSETDGDWRWLVGNKVL